jgi:hypothetical protein
MATSTVKLLVSVEIENPEASSVDKKMKGAQLANYLRDTAEADVKDALTHASLQPQILRVRLAREKA